jgi:HPt (histidine-containing phosphotransfer) domain-containing protein
MALVEEWVMIDWSRVNELRREIGEDGFAEVVEMFLEEVETALARVGSVTISQALAEDMHFLKGSAWNLGFQDFGAVCQDGERRAAAGTMTATDIARLLDSYAMSKTAFLEGLAATASSAA